VGWPVYRKNIGLWFHEKLNEWCGWINNPKIESVKVKKFSMCQGNPVIKQARAEEAGNNVYYMDWKLLLASEAKANIEITNLEILKS